MCCRNRMARGMQVVGAMGFIIASIMLLNETQKHWWQPKPLDIGWHVAFWNLVVRSSDAGRSANFHPSSTLQEAALALAL